MKFQELIRLTATSLVGMAITLPLAAQEPPAAHHHHYKLIQIGTFGGPNSHVHTTGDLSEYGYVDCGRADRATYFASRICRTQIWCAAIVPWCAVDWGLASAASG